jgi:hypothetical protein
MSEVHPNHFLAFMAGWLIVMACLSAGLAQVKTPHLKLVLARILGIVGCAALLLAAWRLPETTNGLLFAAVGCVTVVGLNLLTTRICPHCAKTIYPRRMLALGFCPRCGASLDAPHERSASGHRAAEK